MLLALASQRAEFLAIEWFGPDWMKEILKEWIRKERGSIPGLIESFIILYIISKFDCKLMVLRFCVRISGITVRHLEWAVHMLQKSATEVRA